VQSIVRDVLHKDPRILKNPLPDIVVDSTTDTGITFAVMAWVLNPNFGPVKSDLQKAVREVLIGAKIPMPQQAMVLSGSLQSMPTEEADMQRRQRSA
jgi:small conductance mechanosensitive channel